MLIIFESLMPVYLLIALGVGLRRIEFISDDTWSGIERLSFYVFFPAFLAYTMYKADFSSISFGELTAVFGISIAIILSGGLLIMRPVQRLTGISRPSFSSVYQGFARWNGFVALAIVESLYGTSYLPIVVLGLVTMMIPINFANIFVVTWLGHSEGKRSSVLRQVVTNPLILASLLGIILHLLGITLYAPIENTLQMLSRVTLPLALILVGAGLRVRMPRASIEAAILSCIIKLLFVPALFVSIAMAFDVTGQQLIILGVCGSVPSAMSGYLLARELGGDAPLYAGIITLQSVFSALTIPLVIQLTTMIIG